MLLGHQKQWQFLKKSFLLGRIPHALLFEGQEKVGKKTLAIEFIKLINCQENDFSLRPCQKCLSCQAIGRGVHPDFVFISPIDKEIQISQIRDLSLRLAEKPSLSPFKSAILDEAHLMNQEAQSAFLKTLEEPKGNTILILITEYPERLFSTILSRVQKIKFFPVKKEEIENFLREKGISEEKTKEILKTSLARPGLVIDFLSNPEKLKEREMIIKELNEILHSDLANRFQYVKNLSLKNNLGEILELWLNYFRDRLIQEICRGSFSEKSNDSFFKLKNTLRQIQKINFLTSTTNINRKLALETLMLEI